MRVLKKVFKIIGLAVLGIAAVIAIIYLYADNAPVIHEGYNQKIETGGEIEQKYLQNGSYETLKLTEKAEKPIRKYTVYYPAELESSDRAWPMVLIVNGTGGKATKYEPEFEQLASWGFIVVGNQDKGTGTGETTIATLHWILDQNNDPDSVFYHRIDLDNIGITGHSQGGAAVMNVLTKYEEASCFKCAAPLSPVSENTTEQTTNYTYDSSDVSCPILLLAGTEGEFEVDIVIPIDELNRMYDKIDAPKAMARRTNMTHDDMLYKAEGYVAAWFMWLLQGDEEAAEAFIGDTPELLSNPLYQDQRIDLE